MIPILYLPNETEFKTNGYDRITGATSCVVTEERNGEYELEMECPQITRDWETDTYVSEVGFDPRGLRNGMIIYAQPAYMRDPQPFVIYKIDTEMNDSYKIYARHISYRLAKMVATPFTADGIQNAFAGLKSHSVSPCSFTFESDFANKPGDTSTTKEFKMEVPKSIRSALGGSEGSILDTFGGEFEWDKFKVILHAQRGSDNDVEIRYGKNLLDFKQEENIENTVSAIVPYWTGTVNDQTVTVLASGSTNSSPIVYPSTNKPITDERFQVVDVSQYVTLDKDHTTPTGDQVREAAKQYMKDKTYGKPEVSLDVNFQVLRDTTEYASVAALETVNLCDYIRVYFEPLDFYSYGKVIKTEWDVLNNRYNKVTIGEPKSSLSSTIAEHTEKIEQAPTGNFLTQAINSATKLITGNIGGYVRLNRDSAGNPYELLIMDKEDVGIAKNIWRFNKAGWGHSSTGYNGTYNLAATQDGAIVADMMTAGTLRGINVKGVDFQGNKTDSNGNPIFHVDKDGNLTANSATISGTIVAGANSSIAGSALNLAIKNGNGSFSVDKDGKLTATKGSIGPWTISEYGIYNLWSGSESCGIGYAPDYMFWAGGSAFRVNKYGELWATKAHIGSTSSDGAHTTNIGDGEISTNWIKASGGTIDNLTCKNLKLKSSNNCSIDANGVTNFTNLKVVSSLDKFTLGASKVYEENYGNRIYIFGNITYTTTSLSVLSKGVVTTGIGLKADNVALPDVMNQAANNAKKN